MAKGQILPKLRMRRMWQRPCPAEERYCCNTRLDVRSAGMVLFHYTATLAQYPAVRLFTDESHPDPPSFTAVAAVSGLSVEAS